jgi:GTPase SAR1 family protein
MSEKIKICVVGDRNAGKTIFCNLIAGQFSDPAQLLEHRRPTASLRVLEFEHEIDSKTSIDVELWDCSGDPEQGETRSLSRFTTFCRKDLAVISTLMRRRHHFLTRYEHRIVR